MCQHQAPRVVSVCVCSSIILCLLAQSRMMGSVYARCHSPNAGNKSGTLSDSPRELVQSVLTELGWSFQRRSRPWSISSIRGALREHVTPDSERGRNARVSCVLGTLTQNEMVFKRLHLGTVAYGLDSMDEVQSHIFSIYTQVKPCSQHWSRWLYILITYF